MPLPLQQVDDYKLSVVQTTGTRKVYLIEVYDKSGKLLQHASGQSFHDTMLRIAYFMMSLYH